MSDNINFYSNNIDSFRSIVVVYDNNGDYKKGMNESGTKKYTTSVWTNRLEITHTNSTIQMDPKHSPKNWRDRKNCPIQIIDFNNSIRKVDNDNDMTDLAYFDETLRQSSCVTIHKPAASSRNNCIHYMPK